MSNNLYIPLKNRSFISISGKDKDNFLQSIITNDINKVTENNSIYALILTPQGKFIYDFFIIKNYDSYLIDCDKESTSSIIEKLSMYKLRSNIEISKEPEINSYALIGENVEEKFQLHKEGETIKIKENFYYIDPRKKSMGIRGAIINSKDMYNQDNFLKKGSLEDFEYLRIKSSIASCENDMESNKSFPHKYNFDNLNAIDYKKGCYIGQEVTARVHYKGKIKESLYTIKSKEKIVAKKGDKIILNNETIGTLSSFTENIGIAILDNTHLESIINSNKKSVITINNIEIEIILNI